MKIWLFAVSGSSVSKMVWVELFSVRLYRSISHYYGLPRERAFACVFVYLCSFNIRDETFNMSSSVCYRGHSCFHILSAHYLLPLIGRRLQCQM